MNPVNEKKSYFILLVSLLMIMFIVGLTQLSYAQTNFQALKNQVAELEEKLAYAKERQENAYSIQMKLEEQEQQLASLAESGKYKIQIIGIRADINMIRTKIEAIVKEKNDLEENLRLAKNLQAILGEAQMMAKPGILSNPTRAKPSTQIGSVETVKQPLIKSEITTIKPKESWRIDNIRLSNHFTESEHNEIMKLFGSGHQINQDYLLKNAYQIYNHIGISLHFIIQPKNGNSADLEILLDQREDNNSNSYFTYITPMTPGQFKTEHFSVTIAK